jgi:hypothetical protein
MEDIRIRIRFEPSLKEKVAAMAEADRRTVSNQAAYLMEKGLLVLERQQGAGQNWEVCIDRGNRPVRAVTIMF